MNSGANVGINVLYSGTVGAAREATFNNIPAIAVSLHIGGWDKITWDRAAAHARRAIDRVLTGPMDGKTVLNLNIPVLDDGAEPRGLKVVPASLSGMVVDYIRGVDEAGDTTYQVSNAMSFARREANTDVHALFDKFITVTPLHFDTTCPNTTPAWIDALKK
jgi:5'-nucleotidase